MTKKYDKHPNYHLGLVIIKPFSLATDFSCREPHQLSVMPQVLDSVNSGVGEESEFKKNRISSNEKNTPHDDDINVTFESSSQICEKTITIKFLLAIHKM